MLSGLDGQALRAVANEGAKEPYKAAYKPKACNYLIPVGKS